jgi:hypothetical protein
MNKNISVTSGTLAHNWPSSLSSIYNTIAPISQQQFDSDIDLLAISVHQYRLYRDDPSKRYVSFSTAPGSPGYITPSDEDYQQADIIADYYSSKFTWDLLSGSRELTKFEQAVSEFINSGRRRYTNQSIGLIYRLPEFYYNDQRLTQVITENFAQDHRGQDSYEIAVRRLKPLHVQERKTRGVHEFEYWLKDLDCNSPVKIVFYTPFQLSSVWNTLFNFSEIIMVHSDYQLRQHPLGFEYLRCKNWNLDFEHHLRLNNDSE